MNRSNHAPERNCGGRPRFSPPPTKEERDLVAALLAAGWEIKRIAKLIRGGIADKTFSREFRKELDTAEAVLIATVVRGLARRARQGDVGACAFIMKCRGGWRDVKHIETTGADGRPLIPETRPMLNIIQETIALDRVSNADLEAEYARRRAAKAPEATIQ